MMVTFPDRFQHIAVFIASATLLGLSQLHKQFYKPGVNGLDVPMALMFNFCRATSLVSCVRDGIHIKECAEHNRKNPKNQKEPNLKSREKAFAIEEGIPSFFDFWCYMYFCGAAISEPWYEFKDF